MKFRIVTRPFTDDRRFNHCTEIFDAETGKRIEDVVAVRFEHEVGGRPLLSLTVVPDEVTIEGECDLYPGASPTPAPEPKLLITSDRPLRSEAIQRIMADFRTARGRTIVLDGGFHLYQLVDGRWAPLDPSDPEPSPEGIAQGVTTDPA